MSVPKQLRTILAIWVLTHLGLAALVYRTDSSAQPTIAAILAVLGIIGAAGSVVLFQLRKIQPPVWLHRLRSRTLFFGTALVIMTLPLLALWLIPIPDLTYLQLEVLRGYGTGVALLTIYAVLFWCAPDRAVPWSAWVALGIVAISATFIVTLRYLDRFPQLNTIDELHNWSVQWTVANMGLLGESMFRQMIPLPQPIYDTPHYFSGLLMRLIGDHFWQGRFARMLFSCLMLPFIYLSGKRMYGRRAGLIAVIFAALMLTPTAYVRPDYFVGLMLSVALYVYLRAQTTRRPWLHYLAGFCIAIAGEGHPLAYRFGLTFGLIYIFRWLYQMWQTRRGFIDGRVLALALGGFTGMLIYLAIHIIPNMDQGLHFAKNNSPLVRTFAEQLAWMQDSALRQLQVWITTSPLEFLLLIGGIGLAIRRLAHPDRLLLALIVVSEILLLATYGYYREFYQVHFIPIAALLIGRFLAWLTEWRLPRAAPARLSNFVLVAVLCVIGLSILVSNAQAAIHDPLRSEFTNIGRQLKADLPVDKIIVANEDYFLEMPSLNFYSIQTVTSDHWFLVDHQGYELWEVTNPDIFVLSTLIDLPRYTDTNSIYRYMQDHDFHLWRCYTATGMIEARVYRRDIPAIEPQATRCTAAMYFEQ